MGFRERFAVGRRPAPDVTTTESPYALKLTIAYDGMKLWGSQKQAGVRTVQDDLERALTRVGFERPATVFAGRTDRGVHAVGQVARCGDGRPEWDGAVLARAVNAHLPDDIAVGQVRRVPAGFHPRYDAAWREYRYRIWCGDDQPLVRRQVWSRRARLDIDAMAEAAQLLVGTHDLATFTGGGEGVPWSDRADARRGTTRTVYHCGALQVGAWWGIVAGDGIGIEIRMIADGFLPQLVRTVVGALTTVGSGKRSKDWMAELIGAADRRSGPVTAPPHGLVLWRVGYGGEVPDPAPDGRQISVSTSAQMADG